MLKKVEKGIKKFFDNLISKEVVPILTTKPESKITLSRGSRILLLRQDRIGDVLVSVPFVHALHNFFPDAEIDILLSSKNISAVRAVEDFVNIAYIYDKKIFNTIQLIRVLKKRKYDVVIDMFDNPSTTSAYLIKFINPLCSLGFEKKDTSYYSHIVPLPDKRRFHIVERIANLLLPFGINPAESDLKISFKLSSDEKSDAFDLINKVNKKILGINIAGSNRSKFWGTDKYIEFINTLHARFIDYEVTIFSMPEYEKELNIIIKDTQAIKAPKSNTFVQFASHISACDIILTPDTSVVHLAAAFKVPCVSLHIWRNTEDAGMPWSAYNSPQITLTTSSDSLSNIPVSDALDAVSELLGSGV